MIRSVCAGDGSREFLDDDQAFLAVDLAVPGDAAARPQFGADLLDGRSMSCG